MKNNRKVKYKYLLDLPSLNVKVSYFFISKLCTSFNKTLFQKKLESFSIILKKHEKSILREICKCFQAEWKEKDIFIYPLPEEAQIPSIPFPLLLKLRKNQKLNLYFLIHELIHRFIETNSTIAKKLVKRIGEKRGTIMEAFVVYTTFKIFAKIFGLKETEKMRKLEKKIVTSRDEKRVDEIIKLKGKDFESLLKD
jgi:hypothetical protein